jgi:cell division protein FtsI (penicillin-binding protein 3)
MRVRLVIALGLIAFWAVALEARLVFLQVVAHEEFATQARLQQQNMLEPEPSRGDILDRNGQVLAYSVESHQVIGYPSRSKEPEQDAIEICAALGDCTAKELAKLASSLADGGQYMVVRNPRFVSPAASIRLEALIDARRKAGKPAVVGLVPASRRYYPKLTLAAHLLGFVGDKGHGAEGIEAKYDKVIAGEKGRVFVLVDGRQGGREIATRVERAPTAGASLELTIDLRLQHIAERELAAAVQSADAEGGSVLVMDPFTGEILAQASYPSFNPNSYWDEPAAARRNRVVTDTYEPGSTFKIVTASAALNEGLFKTTDLIDTSPGVINIPGRKPIDEAHRHNYGVLSFEDVLIKSSNIGAIRIGQRVGSDRMMQYVRRYGFGEVLAPDFTGQSRGRVQSGPLDESSLASISMGYEIGVTPLQVASAANVVANGGALVEPHIVRAILRDGRRDVVQPKVLRRVISPETAVTMRALMEGVAERGTAKGAALERYRVAGKTGTASKVVNGRYSDTDYNVSFVGFVPSRKPALTILVVIDTPRRGPAYGGTIAAPIFKRIAEASLQQLGITPSVNPAAPIVANVEHNVGQLFQKPELPTITRVGGRPVMPDIRGLSLRDALRIANSLGLTLSSDGDGVVIEQMPMPGEFVDPGNAGSIRLRRQPAAEGPNR